MAEQVLTRVGEFLLFWGIWMLAPLCVDFFTAVVHLVAVLWLFPPSSIYRKMWPSGPLPFVSVVVPVYNSAATLNRCLKSLASQSYPKERLEVICVDNGSTDGSFEVFRQFQLAHPEMVTWWVSLPRPGKSSALNAGFSLSRGTYLINVDSDTRLERESIMNMVAAFESDPYLVAATGEIRIDKELGRGKNFMDIVHYCEALEYLIAFSVGRRFQSLSNTLFTLSGAFTAFRREALFCSYLYSSRTVAEDTDLTHHLRQRFQPRRCRLGCVAGAVAYVEPISSLERLYTQRVRWQRGQLEVIALQGGKGSFLHALASFTGRILISDHTLALARLTWTFLLPFLYFLGYPLPLVLAGIAGLYVCYLVLDALYFLTALLYVTPEHRAGLRRIWWAVFFLPAFRWTVYWFRLAGIVLALTEEGRWQVENPFKQLKRAFKTWVRERAVKSTEQKNTQQC